MNKPTDTNGYYPQIESLDERSPWMGLLIEALWFLVTFALGAVFGIAAWGRLG